MSKKITVYTPTYNRAYCLHQVYESLCRQTASFDDFDWLVVDDGSTDNTEALVDAWIQEAPFTITYYKQENEGKMMKLNFIHAILTSELCMCVDSDDYLVDDAIERILGIWQLQRNKENIAGIVGLNKYKDDTIVGTKFPDNLNKVKFSHFSLHGIKGDKKFIYKTSVFQKYPDYPSFNNEKFPAPGYLYRLIDVDYNLFPVNDIFCVVEYLEDGLSKNKYKQFVNVPNSWMFYRQERMRLALNYKDKFKNAIHYVSSAMFAKKSIFRANDYLLTTLLALPLGIALNLYIRNTNKKGVV